MNNRDGMWGSAGRLRAWLKLASALGAACFLISLCSVAHAEEPPRSAASGGMNQPRLVYRDRNASLRVALIATGSGLLALTYGLPCVGAGGRWCVPFAGPVLVIAHLDKQERQNDNSEDGIVPPVFVYTLIGSVAALQVISATAIVAGALVPRREVITSARTFTVVPLLSPSMAGLGATGTF